MNVSARELYAFLEPADTFQSWWKSEVRRMQLAEGNDFFERGRILLPGIYAKDYYIAERTAYSMQVWEERQKRERSKKKPIIEYRFPNDKQLQGD